MSDRPQDRWKRRRFHPVRFPLRLLFVLVLIASLYMACKANGVRREQSVVAELAKMQIIVHFDHQHEALPSNQLALRGSASGPMVYPNQFATSPNAPRWLRQWVGDDYFQNVTAVTLFTDDLSHINAALPYLKQLPYLTEVLVSGPQCGFGIPDFDAAKELLESQLPGVKVTGFAIPIVG